MIKDDIKNFIKTHPARVGGSTLGFIIGLLFLVVGFFKTIFLLFCIFVGYYFGRRLDNDEDFFEVLSELINEIKSITKER